MLIYALLQLYRNTGNVQEQFNLRAAWMAELIIDIEPYTSCCRFRKILKQGECEFQAD